MEKLLPEELINLIKAVFPFTGEEKELGILVDIPREVTPDNKDWEVRRGIALQWYKDLREKTEDLDLEKISLFAYYDVGSNNADLPADCYRIDETLPAKAEDLKNHGTHMTFDEVFKTNQLFMAPTENSTTAPLKNAAKKYGFRAATMPGFAPSMLPALRIDYNEVGRRVGIIKELVDPATAAKCIFEVDGEEFHINFDLRFRLGHLSAGRFPEKGIAGNLPSGETYIVPYEGEKEAESLTNGILPVQIGEKVILFTIKENFAVEAKGFRGEESPELEKEIDHLKREPAYGNMAELGFGVLGDFGLTPIREILLDEKLGFHVAFGRSDHFGGNTSPSDFSSPSEVIHLDQVYIPAMQPKVAIKSIVLNYGPCEEKLIFENGKYLVF